MSTIGTAATFDTTPAPSVIRHPASVAATVSGPENSRDSPTPARTRNSPGPDSFTLATPVLIRTRTSGSLVGISWGALARIRAGVDWHDHSPHPAASATAAPATPAPTRPRRPTVVFNRRQSVPLPRRGLVSISMVPPEPSRPQWPALRADSCRSAVRDAAPGNSGTIPRGPARHAVRPRNPPWHPRP